MNLQEVLVEPRDGIVRSEVERDLQVVALSDVARVGEVGDLDVSRRATRSVSISAAHRLSSASSVSRMSLTARPSIMRGKAADSSCSVCAASSPVAESTPGCCGTMIVDMLRSLASAVACKGPAPPRAIKAKSRGSRPRRTETRRMPSEIWVLSTRWMPSAACSTVSARGFATLSAMTSLASAGRSLHGAAGEVVGIDVAEDKRGIRDGRFLAAPSIAGGARLRAGRLRPHAKPASLVEPGDAAATRAEGVDVDHRHPHREVVDHPFRSEHGLPGLDQRYVAARATDVDRDEILDSGRLADDTRADDARRRAGEEEAHRPLPRDRGGEDAAARLHDLQRRGDSFTRETLRQASQIPVHHWLDVGVEGGHDRSLVLAEGRIDVGGDRHVQIREAPR